MGSVKREIATDVCQKTIQELGLVSTLGWHSIWVVLFFFSFKVEAVAGEGTWEKERQWSERLLFSCGMKSGLQLPTIVSYHRVTMHWVTASRLVTLPSQSWGFALTCQGASGISAEGTKGFTRVCIAWLVLLNLCHFAWEHAPSGHWYKAVERKWEQTSPQATIWRKAQMLQTWSSAPPCSAKAGSTEPGCSH